jgi:Flp pilus assembly pilin Flp
VLSVLAFLENLLARPARRDDRGVTSVEYALLVALIVVALIAVVTTFTGVIAAPFIHFHF